MEESSNSKDLKGSNTEPNLQNIKHESDGQSNNGNDKNQQQKDMGIGSQSFSIGEISTGKRSSNTNENEKCNLKKMKFELDFKIEQEESEEYEENKKLATTRKEEESNFLRMFTHVLNTVIAIKDVPDSAISESLPIIIKSFKRPQTFYKTDFSKWKNVCAFLYRYASHGAGFARYRILNAMQNCKIVKNILQKSDLKVIFLGSGAGNDAVGFCSALSELQPPESLTLTLVDKYKEWFFCNKLVKVFIEEGNFGKVSELFQNTNVELSFIQTDLPGKPKSDENYFKILGDADVIVMSKFFTSLDRSNNGALEKAIIKSLHRNMKEDAVVLINDRIFEDRWNGFHKVYEYSVNEEDNYKSIAFAEPRFNSDDDISSILPVYVMVKAST